MATHTVPPSAPVSPPSRRRSVAMWLRGERPPAEVLPGRPPTLLAELPRQQGADDDASGTRFGPRPSPTAPTRADRRARAICCSGGGIRAAAFALGGMQRLGRRPAGGRSFYDGVDLVTAVSGGSYMAASFAMVNHHLSDAERAALPPYAPGSPEDNRLRAHTRYLVEDPRVAAIGVMSILYGLLLNLAPLLLSLFVTSKLLGGLLHQTGLLTYSPRNGWHAHRIANVLLVAAVVGGVGIAFFAFERLHDVYRPPSERLSNLTRAWSLRLLSCVAVYVVLVAGVPLVMQLFDSSRLALGIPPGDQLTSFAATTLGIVAVVRAALGRFKSKTQMSSAQLPGVVTRVVTIVVRAVSPWIGSALAVALFGVALLTWTAKTAYRGLHPRDVVVIAACLLGILAWQALTDINRNSVHPFYKERLCSAFAVRRTGDTADELDYSEPVSLSGYASDSPMLVVCAAVNTDDEGIVPSGRACAPWTFSPLHIGVSSGTLFGGEQAGAGTPLMRPTAEYETLAGKRLVTLPAAVAVSGAAVSPVMGRMTRAPLRLLLGLANVRLGLWLPNPRYQRRDAPPSGAGVGTRIRWQLQQPGMLSLLAELLGRTSLRRRWVYVTDGGHYENLGLVEALRRGATEIVCFDASGDPPSSWSTFGEAVETARADLGVEVRLDPTVMAPTKEGRAATLVARGTCVYPNGVVADLVLCKLALPVTAEASWDVYAWAASHSTFPHDSTAQQLYGDREFEAYRRLGELAAEGALDLLEGPPGSVVDLRRETAGTSRSA